MVTFENLSLNNINGEMWASVNGYEGVYEISNMGRIKSLDRTWMQGGRCKEEHIMRQSFMKNYLSITLCKDGDERTTKIHRLVAKAFIANPTNKKQVNHKNGNKLDNRSVNLEWNTPTENIRHAFEMGLIRGRLGGENPKAKLVLDMQTGIYYDAMSEAAKAKGYQYKWLSEQLNKNNNKTGLVYA